MSLLKFKFSNDENPEKSFFIERITLFFIILFIIVILGLYLITNLYVDKFKSASPALLLAGATLFFGGFIGFLFAIPRRISNSDINVPSLSKYIGNDNLVQISDWLTKIIVGVGLTKLYKIPIYFENLAKHLDIGNIGQNKTTVIESILLFFVLIGFILSYLWTRLYFGKLLEDADKE